MGLAICRRLVDLMGGQIYVDSERTAEGKGSCFVFKVTAEVHRGGQGAIVQSRVDARSAAAYTAEYVADLSLLSWRTLVRVCVVTIGLSSLDEEFSV